MGVGRAAKRGGGMYMQLLKVSDLDQGLEKVGVRPLGPWVKNKG